MDLAHALGELGRHYGIADLRLDAAGRAGLLLDGGRRLLLDHRPEAAALYLRMALLPGPAAPGPERVTALLERLLEANLLGEATLGAVWSIDMEAELLELHRRVPLGGQTPDELALVRALEELYGTALAFARELDLVFANEEAAEEQADRPVQPVPA